MLHKYFITFRPQPNDLSKYHDFIKILIPVIKNNFKNYLYIEENLNTPDQHFHAIIEIEGSHNQNHTVEKITIILYKHLKHAWKMFNQTDTGKSKFTRTKMDAPAWKIVKLPEDGDKNVRDRLGYLYKELSNPTRETNMELTYLLDCVQEYIINEKIRMQKAPSMEGVDEWKILSIGNAHQHIQKYIQDKFDGDWIQSYQVRKNMQIDCYSFAKLSKKAEEDIWEEVHNRHFKDYFTKPEHATEPLEQTPQWRTQMDYLNERLDEMSEQNTRLREQLRKYEPNTNL